VTRALFAVLRRPGLWSTAIRQARRTSEPGWWRRRPFLPLPSGDYLRFRMQTQYGDPTATPSATDTVAYLEWCKAWRRA
jgi:hypothetical protein